MKIGFNMFLWTGRVGPEHYPIMQDIKATGFDGVEVPALEGPVSDYIELSRVLDDMGLERTTCGAIFEAGLDPLSPDPAVRRGALDSAILVLDRVHAVGAKLLCGPMFQVLGQFTGHGPTEDEKAWGVEFHRPLGDAARERGIVVALEPLNRFEAYFLNLCDQASTYVERVDHPNIRFMYDTFHANIEEADPIAALPRNIRHIAHIHISENDRGVPGRGHIPFQATFKAAKAAGYDGWLTIEAFGRSLPAMAAATKIWRDLSDTPEEVYREGFQLIKNGWVAA